MYRAFLYQDIRRLCKILIHSLIRLLSGPEAQIFTSFITLSDASKDQPQLSPAHPFFKGWSLINLHHHHQRLKPNQPSSSSKVAAYATFIINGCRLYNLRHLQRLKPYQPSSKGCSWSRATFHHTADPALPRCDSQSVLAYLIDLCREGKGRVTGDFAVPL